MSLIATATKLSLRDFMEEGNEPQSNERYQNRRAQNDDLTAMHQALNTPLPLRINTKLSGKRAHNGKRVNSSLSDRPLTTRLSEFYQGKALAC